ncbi:hypothetical protein V8F33_005724 [Rhypophila sp. PSN 637]
MVSKPDQDQNQGDQQPQQGEAGEQYSISGVLPLAPPPQYSSSSATAQAAKMTSIAWKDTGITRDATPYPGERFIILHKPSNRPIDVNGEVLNLGKKPYDFSEPIHSELLDYRGRILNGRDFHCTWLCVERNGWLGFRDPTGKYIGQSIKSGPGPHGNRHSLEATATHHKAWEYLCPRRHPRGGYTLLSPIEEDDFKPWLCTLFKVEVESLDVDGWLVLREDGGSLWEFVRVNEIDMD